MQLHHCCYMAFVSLFPVPRAARGLAELCELCSHVIIPSIQACFCYITILINVLTTSNLNTHTSCLDANCGIHLHHINSSHDLPCATHCFFARGCLCKVHTRQALWEAHAHQKPTMCLHVHALNQTLCSFSLLAVPILVSIHRTCEGNIDSPYQYSILPLLL